MAHKAAHRKVRDIMTQDVVAVTADSTAQEIAKKMADNNVGSVLVTEQNRLQGIISDRQLVIQTLAQGKGPTDVLAHQVMTRNPICTGPEADERDAVHLMGEHQIRRLPVVENNQVIGIVSVADLAKDIEDCPDCVRELANELSKAT